VVTIANRPSLGHELVKWGMNDVLETLIEMIEIFPRRGNGNALARHAEPFGQADACGRGTRFLPAHNEDGADAREPPGPQPVVLREAYRFVGLRNASRTLAVATPTRWPVREMNPICTPVAESRTVKNCS